MKRASILGFGIIAMAAMAPPAVAQFLPGFAGAGARGPAVDPEEKLAKLVDASTPTDESRARPNRGRRGDILKNDPYLRAAFGFSNPKK